MKQFTMIRVEGKTMLLDTETYYIYESLEDYEIDTPYMHYDELI